MANFGVLYSEATGKAELARKRAEEAQHNPSESPTEKQLSIQEKIDWLNLPVTTKVFKEMREDIATLENSARELALSYPQHNNHQIIIQRLTIAETLRKVIDKHASPKS